MPIFRPINPPKSCIRLTHWYFNNKSNAWFGQRRSNLSIWYFGFTWRKICDFHIFTKEKSLITIYVQINNRIAVIYSIRMGELKKTTFKQGNSQARKGIPKYLWDNQKNRLQINLFASRICHQVCGLKTKTQGVGSNAMIYCQMFDKSGCLAT